MIDQRQVPQIIGHSVVDSSGEKIGNVGQIYLDDETNQPEWATVRTGWFGMRESFVPLAGATLRGDTLHVAVNKDAVREAPTVDTEGGHLSAEEERQLYRHYGLQYGLPQQQQRVRESAPQAMAGTTTGTTTGTAAGMAAGAAYGSEAGGMSTTRSGMTRDTSTVRSAGTAGMAPAPAARAGRDESTDEITVAEERLTVSTERAQTGQVRMRKVVTTEEQKITVPVKKERVIIERVPVGDSEKHQVTGSEFTEHEQTITLYEEQPRVETEIVATERVRLAKETVTEERTLTGRVRREHVEIDDQSQVRESGPRGADDGRRNPRSTR